MNKNYQKAGETPWIDEERVKEIKKAVSIEAILGHYGMLEGLKQKGSKLVGSAPYREDNNPSFSASLDTNKNWWNDFAGRPIIDGKEVSGDVFGLVQAIKGCSFRDALVELDEKFMGSDNADKDPRQSEVKDKRSQTKEVLKSKKLEVTENIPFGRKLKGRTNIPPLLERGITEETIKKFGVVYCTSGLMKGRIAFPIPNRESEIMAYAGRAVKQSDEDENGKYKFPPKFNKLTELYNVDRIANDAETKKAVKDFGLIVVEGFTDVMKLDQEGFKNVVALMGSVMGEKQKKMLLDPSLNPTRRLTLFLDKDEAGEQGKRKIASDCIYGGAFIRYVQWQNAPEGKTEPEHFSKEELIKILGFNS